MAKGRRRLNPTVVAWLKLWGVASMLGLMPVISNFLSNRFEVSVQDLILPVVLNILTAGLVAGAFWYWARRHLLAGYVGVGLTVLVLTSRYDDRLSSVLGPLQALLPLPDLGGAAPLVASVVLMGLIGAGAYGTGRLAVRLVRRLGDKEREATTALMIGIVTTFGFLLVPLVRDVVVEWPQFFYHAPAVATGKVATPAAKPDIYYIVLDRYASDDVLKQQFGFDDSDFLNFLRDKGYYVNPSAHNNYPYTTMSIASTMQADYLNASISRFGSSSEQTVVPFNETIRQSPVARVLQSIGYRYDLIGNWYETSNLSEVADTTYQQTGRMTILGQHVTLNNFSKNILTQSALWRFIQPGLKLGGFTFFSYTNLGDVDMTHYALTTLRNEVNQPAGGRFIFAHILVPHDPYYFNGDGSLQTNSGSDNVGAPIKQKYLGQIQYINSQMKAILTQIDTASQGKAVVVLQSDEGPYPLQLNDENFDVDSVEGELQASDMRKWSNTNLEMKFGNLAAYRIPQADLASDASAADSANVFRLVLNTYFGTTLPYLPDCYYAYPDGRDKPQVFTDITARLTGQPADARCLADGRVKE